MFSPASCDQGPFRCQDSVLVLSCRRAGEETQSRPTSWLPFFSRGLCQASVLLADPPCRVLLPSDGSASQGSPRSFGEQEIRPLFGTVSGFCRQANGASEQGAALGACGGAGCESELVLGAHACAGNHILLPSPIFCLQSLTFPLAAAPWKRTTWLTLLADTRVMQMPFCQGRGCPRRVHSFQNAARAGPMHGLKCLL